MSRFKKLLELIHRRSLWQVLLVYLGASYAILEALDLFTERFGLPDFLFTVAIVLMLIGLPTVLLTTLWGRGERPAAEAAIDRPGLALGGVRRFFTWRKAILGSVLALALWGAIAAAWLVLGNRSGAASASSLPAPDPNVVAVLPFRVAGAEPALDYLREGMLDLLAAKLTGEGGPRAVDPRAVVSAWNRIAGPGGSDVTQASARELARTLGAGRVLLGGLVGTASHIVLNATLLSVSDEASAVQASVEGPTDSLTALVDRLTAQLLAQQAGESQQRLAALTSTSLPALRAYLDGQATYRRGNYADAERLFRRAIEIDSTFALAALGYVSARFWTANLFDREGLSLAWEQRDRLSVRDRALLLALAGPNFPRGSAYGSTHAALERAVESAPDRPEAWYSLGESYYHQGPALGFTEPHQMAGDAFAKAVELDSGFAAPLSHLVDLAIMDGERDRARRLLSLFLAVDSTGEFREYERWQAALAFGDTAMADLIRGRFDELSTLALRAVVRTSLLKGFPQADAELAASILRERSGTSAERWGTLTLLHDFELDRGRPSAALALSEGMPAVQPEARFHLKLRVLDALYGGGDTLAATEAVKALESYASSPLADRTDDRAAQFSDICAVEQWRLWHGQFDSARHSIDRLRSATFPADSSLTVGFARTCAALLDALHAALTTSPDADVLVARFDSLIRTLPEGAIVPLRLDRVGNLAVAQLLEAQGDLEAAYRAVQRREFFMTRYLASYLREEGRLATLVGDRDGAIRAYRHYLTLRSDPEPALADETEWVRSELARLTGEADS